MTESEQARIAVLENEIKHANEKIDRIAIRQDEMYNLMMQGKGGWKSLALLGGIFMAIGGLGLAIAQYFTK